MIEEIFLVLFLTIIFIVILLVIFHYMYNRTTDYESSYNHTEIPHEERLEYIYPDGMYYKNKYDNRTNFYEDYPLDRYDEDYPLDRYDEDYPLDRYDEDYLQDRDDEDYLQDRDDEDYPLNSGFGDLFVNQDTGDNEILTVGFKYETNSDSIKKLIKKINDLYYLSIREICKNPIHLKMAISKSISEHEEYKNYSCETLLDEVESIIIFSLKTGSSNSLDENLEQEMIEHLIDFAKMIIPSEVCENGVVNLAKFTLFVWTVIDAFCIGSNETNTGDILGFRLSTNSTKIKSLVEKVNHVNTKFMKHLCQNEEQRTIINTIIHNDIEKNKYTELNCDELLLKIKNEITEDIYKNLPPDSVNSEYLSQYLKVIIEITEIIIPNEICTNNKINVYKIKTFLNEIMDAFCYNYNNSITLFEDVELPEDVKLDS